jgi:tRNA 2-thiouridine synthesizing protein B
MPVLHIVNRSPNECSTLAACVSRLGTGDALLLIEQAVYAALSGTSGAEALRAASGAKIYVLGPHLEVRGLFGRPVAEGITEVDFHGFVELTVTYPTSVSWG